MEHPGHPNIPTTAAGLLQHTTAQEILIECIKAQLDYQLGTHQLLQLEQHANMKVHPNAKPGQAPSASIVRPIPAVEQLLADSAPGSRRKKAAADRHHTAEPLQPQVTWPCRKHHALAW